MVDSDQYIKGKYAMKAPARYHRLVVALHWLLMPLIIMMLILGTFVTGATPNSDPEKINHLSGHMPIGMLIGLLMIVRLITRRLTAAPEGVSSNTPAENRLASAVHILLYVLVFIMVGSGIGMAVMANLPAVVFQGHGTLPADFTHLVPRRVHGIASVLLALLISLHVAAALVHQFVKKDDLIARMWFGKK